MSTSANFRPTTLVTILRTSPSTLTDEFGDPADNETVSSTGNPFSIIMQSKRQFLPSENRTTVVENIAARCRGNVDVKETDRLKDERTSFLYMIESIIHPQDPIGASAISMTLRRIKTDNL
jgi:hypothetical protein